jgi:single-stranded DNA-specific DHH superfamily exonuclease
LRNLCRKLQSVAGFSDCGLFGLRAGLREQNAALREQNAAHTVWRGFAEAQAKQLAEQLAEAKATNATLQKQIAEGANKEVLANTAASSSRAIGVAGMTIEKFVDGFEAVRLLRARLGKPTIGSPEPPSKGSLLDEPPKSVLD